MTEYDAAAERANASFSLRGDSPRTRWLSAEIIIKLDRRQGKTTPQWVIDVYEGRLPA